MAALDGLTGLNDSFAQDYVGIFTQDFQQIFSEAHTIKIVVKEESKVMEHPVETGIVITDHRIILPIQIDVSLILASTVYQDIYRQIRQYYLNGTLLLVQTRSDTYGNQLIQSMPHEEDPTQFDILAVALSLKEVIFVTPQFGVVPKNNKDSTTQKKGTQMATPAPAEQTTYAYDGLNAAKRAFS